MTYAPTNRAYYDADSHVAEQIALGDELIAKSKEIQALGAFDRADRSVAMDMLGFKKQLVFASHSVVTPFHPSSKVKPELRDVGRFIDQSNPDLYLFSSDYPHVEGGRDPLGRFETSLGDRSEAIRTSFYTENFLRIFPDARV